MNWFWLGLLVIAVAAAFLDTFVNLHRKQVTWWPVRLFAALALIWIGLYVGGYIPR